MRPSIPIIAAVLITETALTAAAWNPLKILRHGKHDVEREEFVARLDTELPGALKRLAWRASENWWVRGVAAAAGSAILAHLGWKGKGMADRRKVNKEHAPSPK